MPGHGDDTGWRRGRAAKIPRASELFDDGFVGGSRCRDREVGGPAVRWGVPQARRAAPRGVTVAARRRKPCDGHGLLGMGGRPFSLSAMRLEEDGGEKRPRMGTELPQHAQQQLLEALRASSAQPCVLPIGAPALVPPLPNPNLAPPPLRLMLAPAPAAAAAADGATAQTSAELALREMGFSADDAAFGAREAGGDVDAATLLLVSRIEAREQVLQIDAARVASEMDAEQRAELAAAEARQQDASNAEDFEQVG